MAVTALACGHLYCDACWEQYITLKVFEGQTSITCPEPKCKLQVREDIVRGLCSENTVAKYNTFLLDSQVSASTERNELN